VAPLQSARRKRLKRGFAQLGRCLSFAVAKPRPREIPRDRSRARRSRRSRAGIAELGSLRDPDTAIWRNGTGQRANAARCCSVRRGHAARSGCDAGSGTEPRRQSCRHRSQLRRFGTAPGVLARHGKSFFLATKTDERTAEKARRQIHRSLEHLRIDHVHRTLAMTSRAGVISGMAANRAAMLLSPAFPKNPRIGTARNFDRAGCKSTTSRLRDGYGWADPRASSTIAFSGS